jgi:sensor histidine kinase YesM
MNWIMRQFNRLNGGRSVRLATVYLAMSCLLVLISFLIFMPFQYLYTTQVISRQLQDINQNSLQQTQGRLTIQLASMEQHLINLSGSTELQRLMADASETGALPADRQEATQQLNSYLARVKNAYDDIGRIDLITDKMIFSSNSNQPIGQTSPEVYYRGDFFTELDEQLAVTASGVILRTTPRQATGQQPVNQFITCIRKPNSASVYLVFHMHSNWLDQLLETGNGMSGLFDQHTLQPVSINSVQLQPLDQLLDSDIDQLSSSGTTNVTLDGQLYTLSWQVISTYNLVFVVLQDLAVLLAPLKRVRQYTLIVALGSFIFSLVFIRVLSRRVLHDLTQLTTMAEQYTRTGAGQLLPLKYKARGLNDVLSFYLFAVMAVPIIVFCLLFTGLSIRLIDKSRQDLIMISLDKQAEQIDSFIKNDKSLSERLMFDKSIQQIIKQKNAGGQMDTDALTRAIADIAVMSDPMQLIYYDESGRLIYTNQLSSHAFMPQIGDQEKASYGEMVFSIRPAQQHNMQPFGFIRKIKNLAIDENMGMQTIGYLACYYHKSILDGIVGEPFMGRLYLIDEKQQLLYASYEHEGLYSPEALLADPATSDILANTVPDEPVVLTDASGRRRLLFIRHIDRTQWAMVLDIDQASFWHDHTLLLLFNTTITLLFFVLSFLLSRLLSGYTFKPVIRLIEHLITSDPALIRQQTSVFFPNELNELIYAFNHMTQQVVHLYKLEAEKNKIELWALQSQINPHFMYNAFESIRWMNKRNDRDSIDQMIGNLRQLFRVSMSSEISLITLEEECAIAAAYLSIQKMRYGKQLTDQWNIQPATQEVLLPKFILQPLIENAINHGVRELEEQNGIIRITSRLENDQLILTVMDNGPGIPPAQLAQLQLLLSGQPADQKQKRGIGLINVYRRLALYYQDQFCMKLYSLPCQETGVVLMLPLGKPLLQVPKIDTPSSK